MSWVVRIDMICLRGQRSSGKGKEKRNGCREKREVMRPVVGEKVIFMSKNVMRDCEMEDVIIRENVDCKSFRKEVMADDGPECRNRMSSM